MQRPTVTGAEVTEVDVGSAAEAPRRTAWASLADASVAPGPRTLAFAVPAGSEAVLVPVCAGRRRVLVDDADARVAPGPVVLDMPGDGRAHRVTVELDVSGYEHRVACGESPRVGSRAAARDGLLPLRFASPRAASGGGQAVVYVPPGHDMQRPAALLVGLHPWNGTPWTYAAYEALLSAARAADVVLLFPSGLGNSLYTEPAEDEVLAALAALREALPVDPDRITLWGASMGGAGATTIGLHHPDRFAAIVSLFGDSKYDLTTYVRSILHDAAGAHRVNALDIVENARNVPVWLVHGESDHVSPVAQSAMLARALTAMHFAVTFDRVPGAGHEGRVVTAFAARIVDLAAQARRTPAPRRVSYWSVTPRDTGAYGIRMTRASAEGDAFFDVEREGDAVHVRSAVALRELVLPRGAFGVAPTETLPVVIDDPRARDVAVRWDTPP
jgi:pimeloyl-ACP methyl ester carboxylesterase